MSVLQILGIQEKLDFRTGIRRTFLEIGSPDRETSVLIPVSDASMKVLATEFQELLFASRNAEEDEEVHTRAKPPEPPSREAPVRKEMTTPQYAELPEIPGSSAGDDWRQIDDRSEGGPEISPE